MSSQRGKGGGYVLARDPATISFADVIDLIDGSNGGKGRMRGGDQADALVAPVWDAVRECTRAYSDRHHRRRRGASPSAPDVLHLIGDRSL